MTFAVPKKFHEITKEVKEKLNLKLGRLIDRAKVINTPTQVEFFKDKVIVTHKATLIHNYDYGGDLKRIYEHSLPEPSSSSWFESIEANFEKTTGRKTTIHVTNPISFSVKKEIIKDKPGLVPVHRRDVFISCEVNHSDLPKKEQELMKAIASAKGKEREKLVKLVKRSWLKVA